ncbi:MAG: glucose 1-dehydrogenase [Alphaproteobacteria bacterium]|nr:glucose 1-dehydrogenase [Alphaproteobacteria bacterium]
MSGRLSGKTAVITGGASGIGRATVELFLAEGANVVIGDIQDELGASVAQASPNAVYQHADVTREADVKALIDRAVETFGRIDILFNNAGAAEPDGGFAAIDEAGFNHVMQLHLASALYGIKHAETHMRAQKSGSIITTSSVAAIGTAYGPILYSIAKAAVLHMTRLAAVRLAADGVRVNAIQPGVIATAIFGRALGLDQEASEEKAAVLTGFAPLMQPLRVAGAGRDIAEAVLYLASGAARFVTGQSFCVDGGLTAGQVPDSQQGVFKPLAELFAIDPS